MDKQILMIAASVAALSHALAMLFVWSKTRNDRSFRLGLWAIMLWPGIGPLLAVSSWWLIVFSRGSFLQSLGWALLVTAGVAFVAHLGLLVAYFIKRDQK
jgi:hypothetical protein